MTMSGIMLASAPNDPDFSKAQAILEHVRQVVQAAAAVHPPAVQLAAKRYAEALLAQAAENLPRMRGTPGARH
jgi:hypothetical protein